MLSEAAPLRPPEAAPLRREPPPDGGRSRGPARRVEVKILDTIKATIVQPGTALKLRARQETKDAGGTVRQVRSPP